MVLSIMTTFLSEYSQIFPYMSPPASPQEKNPTSVLMATEIAPTVV